MKTLILGGAGFIGSHIAEKLLEEGHHVEVIDNLQYCFADNLPEHKHLVFTEADLFTHPLADEWDEIYLCAALCSTPDFIKDPVTALEIEIAQVRMACDYAMCAPHEVRVLYLSSSEIYGTPNVIPTPENYIGGIDVASDRSGYSAGKLAGEALLHGYHRCEGVRASVVRLFNVYGPRQTDQGNMIACMVKDALEEGKITVHGSGDTTRTLVYVDDAVEGIHLAMEAQHDFPINIGGEYEFVINRFAHQIAGHLNAEVFHDHSVYDPIARRRPDITTAKRVLGWQPKTDQHSGLVKTIEYWEGRI